MAYQKLQSGEFMVIGYVPKDAEIKKVGQNGSSKTSFSVKASETTGADGKKVPNWTSCVAWHEMARICAGFKKGDFVMAIGKIEEREYEGKKYKDLVVEFATKAGGMPVQISPSAAPSASAGGQSGNNNIGDLSEFEVLLEGDMPF